MTYISWSTDFCLYLEDYLVYEHHTLDYESVWPNIWPQNKSRSLWPIFHGPLILPYEHHYLGLESVWHDSWPRNKCRSLWPIFHGPVILPSMSKTIWWMSVIFSDETVWPKFWPQNIFIQDYLMDEHHSWYNGSVWQRDWPHQVYVGQWPIFYDPVNLLLIWKTIRWRIIVFGIMVQWHRATL